MRRLFLLLAIFIPACGERNQESRLDWVEPPPRVVEYGQPFDVEVEWQWPKEATTDPFTLEAFSPFEAEWIAEDDLSTSELSRLSRRLRLRGYQLGVQRLQLPFRVIGEEGVPIGLLLSASVEVASSLGEGEGLAVERPVIGVVDSDRSVGRKLGIAALMGLALAACWFYGRTWFRAARQHKALRESPWRRFEALLRLPRETRVQQLELARAIRESMRSLVRGRSWSGEELERLIQLEYHLTGMDQQSLKRLIAATEEACFAADVDPQQRVRAVGLVRRSPRGSHG